MGNPLACAVALKGIEIFEREDYMSKICHIEQASRREMEAFTDSRIKEVRIMGGFHFLRQFIAFTDMKIVYKRNLKK